MQALEASSFINKSNMRNVKELWRWKDDDEFENMKGYQIKISRGQCDIRKLQKQIFLLSIMRLDIRK